MAQVDETLRQAVAYHNAGHLTEAADLYRAILAEAPGHAQASHNLGVMEMAGGRFAQAIPLLKAALEHDPAQSTFWLSYVEALMRIGRREAATGLLAEGRRRGLRGPQVEALAAALAARPPSAEAVAAFRRGNALRLEGRMQEAEVCFREAVTREPGFADAQINLGNALRELGRLAEAEAAYRLALQIDTGRVEALENLGNALRDQGRLDDAAAAFLRAHALQPQAAAHAFQAAMLLPPMVDSVDQIELARGRYLREVEALTAVTAPGGLDDPGALLHLPTFYLAYHDRDDRQLMEATAALFRRRLPALGATAAHVGRARAAGARIRVGVLSEYLHGHTIGKLYQGLIGQLDRRRFEVVVIHPLAGGTPDALQQAIDRLADRSVTLPPGLAAQQRAVGELELDALFYPDIGMSPTTYFLAFARLAPVQAVSWGHPDTSGLDSIDYFISADPIEPGDGEAHYTERLVRLSRLPCYYQPLVAPSRIPDRAALGLPERGALYVCPQSLFKFHPDFDAVLDAIAEGDPGGHVLVIEAHIAEWTAALRRRWARHAPALARRARFLPRQPLERFMALLAHADVLLDPLHFGSGNSLYEGMVYGTPVVTWPGRFMRGRIVAGAYGQMGIADAPIAARVEDYAPLALALGRDPARRAALRSATCAAAGPALYADRQVVREFEVFMVAAVEAAARGTRLPSGWRPGPTDKDSS